MIFGSVCSGIEAASVAWHPLGWRASFLSEIEKFPRAVLAHHYPETELHGDFTTIETGRYAPIDLLVGGTPCQSFSVAGLRGGMADARGNLALEYLRLADRLNPRWIVWENVPGVLSSNGGRDFGSFLGGLAELGYGWAYRVLDAQFFGLAQRRKRVFVVGYFGDWRRAAAVLFERESMSGHPAPRRKAGKGIAPTISARPTGGGGLGTDFDIDGGLIQAFGGNNTAGPIDISTAINSHGGPHGGPHGRVDFESETFLVTPILDGAKGRTNKRGSRDGTALGESGGPMFTLREGSAHAIAFTSKDSGQDAAEDLAPTLRGGGHDKSHANGGVGPAIAYSIMPQNSGKDYKAREVEVAQPVMGSGPVGGNQGGDYIVQPLPFDTTQVTSSDNYSNPAPGDACHPLAAGAHPPAIAFALRGREGGAMPEVGGDQANALRAASGGSTRDYLAFNTRQDPIHGEQVPPIGAKDDGHGIFSSSAVRRLTPRECERLQGFPDDYTAIPWNKKTAPDGPRYKALGNSMAVPVMSWIGRRIEMVDAL